MTSLTDEYLAMCIETGEWRCTPEQIQETAARLLKEKRSGKEPGRLRGHDACVVRIIQERDACIRRFERLEACFVALTREVAEFKRAEK